MFKNKQITVAKVAELFGVPRSTIRKWSDRGILEGWIDPNGWRRFDEKYIFIKRANLLAKSIRGEKEAQFKKRTKKELVSVKRKKRYIEPFERILSPCYLKSLPNLVKPDQ